MMCLQRKNTKKKKNRPLSNTGAKEHIIQNSLSLLLLIIRYRMWNISLRYSVNSVHPPKTMTTLENPIALQRETTTSHLASRLLSSNKPLCARHLSWVGPSSYVPSNAKVVYEWVSQCGQTQENISEPQRKSIRSHDAVLSPIATAVNTAFPTQIRRLSIFRYRDSTEDVY